MMKLEYHYADAIHTICLCIITSIQGHCYSSLCCIANLHVCVCVCVWCAQCHTPVWDTVCHRFHTLKGQHYSCAVHKHIHTVWAVHWDNWTIHMWLAPVHITHFPLLFSRVFYFHNVLLFPMELVTYSSALWQIRCAVKWSMTESSGRLHPLQSYPAITIPSFLWGNAWGWERKLDQILL